MKEKNTVPEVKKFVLNSEDSTWGKLDNAQIGDTVYFKLEVKDGRGTDSAITVYDVMAGGMSLTSGSIEVYLPVLGSVAAADITETPTNYTKYYKLVDGKGKPEQFKSSEEPAAATTYYLKLTEEALDANTSYTSSTSVGQVQDYSGSGVNPVFSVVLKKALVTSMGTGNMAYIFFNATLDRDAVTATNESATKSNDNSAFLKYSNQTTPPDTVNVYTHQFDLVKDDTSTKALLGAAEFNLYRDYPWDDEHGKKDATKTPISFVRSSNVYTVVDGLVNPNSQSGDPAITTSASAKTTIKGLDVGTYYLLETKAPNGYIPLTAPIKVVVSQVTPSEAENDNTNTLVAYETRVTESEGRRDGDGLAWTAWGITDNDATLEGTNYKNGGIEVHNTAGTELPSTGGMGTTVLYIVGGMLVILAGAYLFFSRKRTA